MPNAEAGADGRPRAGVDLQPRPARTGVAGSHDHVPARCSARPRAFFEETAGKVGGRVDSVLGVPAFVLDAQDGPPAEVELVMGDTHIVLVGTDPEVSSDQLLEVAASMAPLH